MAGDRFHLGCFTSFKPPDWQGPWSGELGETWADGRFFIDMVKAMERAYFDYVIFEDSSMVSDAYGGTSEADLKYALYAPKHDPLMLMPLLAKYTSHIGLIATASTTFYPPFLLARSMATLDHLTAGRTGWNIVTSSEDRAAQNYGLDGLPDHDERYRRADEFVEVLEALWDSWEPDARVMDHEAGIYVDHTKVHTVDFEGKWYRSRGPLNTLRSPQGRPVFCQAGSSPTGRDFAARHADTILASVHGLEAMKTYREDMHRRLEAAGRDPGTCKVLFVIMPTLGETAAEAADKKARAGRNATAALASMSAITEVDFSVFDLDAPLPDVTTNGHAGYLSEFARFAGQRSTLREALRSWSISCLDLVGEPAEVAEKMAEAMAFIGGDGFLFTGVSSRRYTTELVDGLVPELQKLDVVRRSYDGSTFRENLLSF